MVLINLPETHPAPSSRPPAGMCQGCAGTAVAGLPLEERRHMI
jgi:hypothetical protein